MPNEPESGSQLVLQNAKAGWIVWRARRVGEIKLQLQRQAERVMDTRLAPAPNATSLDAGVVADVTGSARQTGKRFTEPVLCTGRCSVRLPLVLRLLVSQQRTREARGAHEC